MPSNAASDTAIGHQRSVTAIQPYDDVLLLQEGTDPTSGAWIATNAPVEARQ